MSAKPLDGIKVLDFSRVVSGPYVTRLMADLGADVLKIEPPEGDLTRKLGAKSEGVSGYFLQQNINKRNVCIDMKADGAHELILELAKQADIVVENFRPGVMEKFHLGWDDLKTVNPKLVMLSISGFGQKGPERGRAAFAPIMHAETGLIARQADATDGKAVDLQLSVADTFTSLHGLVGLLAALRVAEQTGVGQQVDVSMIASVHSTDDYPSWALDNGWPRAEENVIWDAVGGNRILISGDLRWIWHVLSNKVGVVDPTPKGADLETKIRMRREAIAEWIAAWDDFEALCAKLDSLNLAWGRVRNFGEDAYSQPSVQALGVLVDVKDDAGNPRKTVQSPYRFSHSESGLEAGSRQPGQGEDNASALNAWLGMGAADVEALSASGVLLNNLTSKG